MRLHIISFDIPYPANYGGVIAVFNQVKTLHALGVKIYLHCYQYDERKPQPELAKYCEEVYYYPRSKAIWYQLGLTPFIMRTRNSSRLFRRLKKDNYPILFQGMHTCAFIDAKKLRSRQKIVQMHNIEWQYYEHLFDAEEDVLKKIYYFSESIKLERIEPKVVLHADKIITLSTIDEAYYRERKSETYYIPVCHPNEAVESMPGRSKYVLFHGKLSVADNEKAALYLIKEIFSQMDIGFIVAGMDPSDRLREAIAPHEHIKLVANPSEDEMNKLVQDAQINLLVSFQTAGIKLKLINALFRGRFCIVNENMVKGSNLRDLCYVRNSVSSIRQTIEAIYNTPFEESHIQKRREVLEKTYSNLENGKKLLSLIRFESQDNK